MNFKQAVLTGAFALSFGAVQAAPVVQNFAINLVGNAAGLTAGLSNVVGGEVNHQAAGQFIDHFTFNYAGSAWIDAFLTTSASLADLANQQIIFQNASINGISLTLDADEIDSGTIFRSAYLIPSLADGSFVLTVEGWAGALNATPGARISASYSGGLNVTPLANNVPEPSTLALLAVSFGGLAFVSRRRKTN